MQPIRGSVDYWDKFLPDSLPDFDDTLQAGTDSLQGVSDTLWYPLSANMPADVINYSGVDSIVYEMDSGKTEIYTKGVVTYQTFTLKSDSIVFFWNTKTLLSKQETDSAGNKKDPAYFEDGDENFTANQMLYRFDTQKGKIYYFRRQEGEGFITGKEVKKVDSVRYYGHDLRYTTCDLEHPHFYIVANKAEVVQGKIAVTGPAHLVIADVPTPIFLPFGIFPIKRGQTSGIIFPQYGNHETQGYFLRDGGYYFAINDYVDLSLTGDIYSRGSWGLHAQSNYNWLYHFRGSFGIQYNVNKYGLSFDPAYSANKGFYLTWMHTQDPKARPNTQFSSNVNFGSSDYLQENSYSSVYLTNQLNSSVSWSKIFAGTPFSISAALRHNQNTGTHIVNLTLPDVTFSMTRINPFKNLGNNYNNPLSQFGITYTMSARNYISRPDSLLFDRSSLSRFQNGFQHQLSASAPVKIFNYFTLSPSANYTEVWYLSTIRKNYHPDTSITNTIDPISGETQYDTTITYVQTDTVPGFRTGRYYSFGASVTTKLYGLLQFHGKIKAIRHVMTPSLGFTYKPDFSDPKYGYYGTYYPSPGADAVRYSIFDGLLFGGPSAGKVGSLSLNIGNTLEMKVYSRKDTVTHEKKIKLLENFNVGASYNLAADSLNLSDIAFSGYTTLFEKVKLNFSGSFDPYITDSLGRSINTFEWDVNHRIGRFNGGFVSLSTSFRSKRNDNPGYNTTAGTEAEREMVWDNPDEYIDFEIPWDFNVSYNLNVTNIPTTDGRDSLHATQSATFSGDLNVTPNWKVSLTSGYDFQLNEFTYTSVEVYRDLHCWEMGFKWIPFGLRQSYIFTLNVKASVLQDLKLTRKKDWSEY